MQLSRRSFLMSFTAALAMPRLALPVPAPGMVDAVAPELVAFQESYDASYIAVRTRVVLIGDFARQAIAKNPHLWSAVLVSKRLT